MGRMNSRRTLTDEDGGAHVTITTLDGHVTAVFNVSNRLKASGVFYGSTVEHICDTVIAAAVAQFQGADTHAALLAELDADYRVAWQEWQTALLPPAM